MEGQRFGRYRLIALLGRGGMGEVWRAYDTETDRIIALKLLPDHWLQNTQFQQRFRREAHMAAGLNNPHIVPIHHYGDIDGRLYVDMRLIDGRDLGSILANGPLTPRRAVGIIGQIAKALHAAHKVWLVHRDVKPSNILLTDDDFSYLIDFGIATAGHEARLTSTGAVIGTWQYIAPERLSGLETDWRSDIYALACVLYECLTGMAPFPGDSLESQVAAHLAALPPRPSITNPDVPRQFDAIIATGMAKDPGQRYQTTVEMAEAAYQALSSPPPMPKAPTQQPRPHDAQWVTPTLAGNAARSDHSDGAHRLPGGASIVSIARRLWTELDIRTRVALGLVVMLAATVVVGILLTLLSRLDIGNEQSGYETVQPGPVIDYSPPG